ncbi:MAG: hypothetical protein LBF76_01975, partial [Holosporales bacterium]|nr:hypothetical protein [Holosporales bacterium]
ASPAKGRPSKSIYHLKKEEANRSLPSAKRPSKVPLQERENLLFSPGRRNDGADARPTPVSVKDPEPAKEIPDIFTMENRPPPLKKRRPKQRDTLSLNSAYISGMYADAQLADFGMEVIRLGARAEEAFEESFVARWSVRLLGLWVGQAFTRSYHEMGHALRARALGYTYALKNNDAEKRTTNFFSFFGRSLVSNGGSDCVILEEEVSNAQRTSSTTTPAALAGEGSRRAGRESRSTPVGECQFRRAADGDEKSYGIEDLAKLLAKKTQKEIQEQITRYNTNKEEFEKIYDKQSTIYKAMGAAFLEEAGDIDSSKTTTTTVTVAPTTAIPVGGAPPAETGETRTVTALPVGEKLAKTLQKVTAQLDKIAAAEGDTEKKTNITAIATYLKSEETQKQISAIMSNTAAHIEETGQKLMKFRDLWMMHFAGYHSSIYFSERLSERIYAQQDVTFVEGCAYFFSYFSALGYSRIGSHAFDMSRCIDPLGLPIEKETKKSLNSYAPVAAFALTLLNGTTYHIIHATFEAMSGNEHRGPWEPLGFRFPDIFLYFTTRGISLKVNSGFRVNDDLRFIFGAERVLGLERTVLKKKVQEIAKRYGFGDEDTLEYAGELLYLKEMFVGKPAMEGHFGLQHTLGENWNNLTYRGVITFGSGVCFEGLLQLPITKDLGVSFGGATYATKSLLGERHARDLSEKRSGNLFLSVFYHY